MPRPRKEGKPAEPGSRDTESAEGSTSTRKSTRSGGRSSGSKKHWQQPSNAREFASQVNAVATLVLNEQLDLDRARTYASLARVVSQTLSVESTRARFLKEAPDLDFEEV